MKKTIYISVLAFLLCITLDSMAYNKTKISFDLKFWLARGYLNWTVSGYKSDPYYPRSRTRFKSELDWDMDTNMLILEGELQPTPWLFIDATYGIGKIQRGICTDTDWLLDYSSSVPFIKTESPSTGNSHFYNFDINLRVLGTHSQLGFLDLFTGYGSTSTKVLIADPLSYIYYEWIYLGGHNVYLGLNSIYDIAYEGLRVGIRGKIRLLSRLELSADVAYSPSLLIRGEGFWNLRHFRFRQFGKGDGLECKFTMGIFSTEKLLFELGYKNQLLKITDSQYWETCEAKQSGFFISGTYRF